MPTTEHIHLPLYTDEETPDLSTTGHYNHAMEIIDANVGELEAEDAELAEDIADEREARIAGDSALDAKLAAETKARTDADTALDTAYKAADTALGKRIDAETAARGAADTALGSRVDNAETEISANSADLTGIKGLTYGAGGQVFLENEGGEYSSPALEEIRHEISDINWGTLKNKPFYTIGTGLKVVSAALTVDTSALPSGLTPIAVSETSTAADVYAKAQAAWPNCMLSGDTLYYPYAELPAVGSQAHTYLFTASGGGATSVWAVNATSMTHESDIMATANITFGDFTKAVTA